jgi:TRAP-type C4-dicarboxylate transport system permease small subunit
MTVSASTASPLARVFYGGRVLFERVLEIIVVALMVLLAVLVIVAVFLRYSGAPLHYYDEVASMLLAWLTYYGSALAAYRGSHIAFPGLINAMRPALKIPFVLFGKVLVIGFFAVVAWVAWQAMAFLEGDALITLRWFPQQLAQHVVLAGAVLYIAAELLRTPEHIRYATTGERMAGEH